MRSGNWGAHPKGTKGADGPLGEQGQIWLLIDVRWETGSEGFERPQGRESLDVFTRSGCLQRGQCGPGLGQGCRTP